MPQNRVVVYRGPGKVEVESTDYPKLEIPGEVADASASSVVRRMRRSSNS